MKIKQKIEALFWHYRLEAILWCFKDSSCEYRMRRWVLLTSSKNKSFNSIYGEYITGERHVRSNYILWARIVCQGSHCTEGCPDI